MIGRGMIILLNDLPILFTDLCIFRVKMMWEVEDVRHYNNILATMESPIYFAVTTQHNTARRKANKRFVFTITKT
jgi:hypothetical protein